MNIQSSIYHKPVRIFLSVCIPLLLLTVGMSGCSDIPTHQVYDEEELDIMTDLDRNGERGYHQVVIFMGDENLASRHEESLRQLRALQPDHILNIRILESENAVDKYGQRGEHGVIEVTTHQQFTSYNTVLQAMGLKTLSEEEYASAVGNSGTSEDFFMVVEEMPELVGGLATLNERISYPELARRAGIEGRVFVQFIVNEQGRVESPRIIRGIGGGCDEEALRVVSQAEFSPGLQGGEPVRVQYSLPIQFHLQGEEI